MGGFRVYSLWIDGTLVRVGGTREAPLVEVELCARGRSVGVVDLSPAEATMLRNELSEVLLSLSHLWPTEDAGVDVCSSEAPEPPF